MQLLIRVSVGLLAIAMIAGCSREPEVLVMAATSTPQGAIVPTRAPTLTVEATATLPPTDTTAPTLTPTVTDTADASETPASTDTATPTVTPEEVEGTPAASILTPTASPSADDADGDGLSLEQEQAAGTDPNLSDTDLDGLSDGDEITLWGTNPLEIDTDNDLLSDGEEAITYGTSLTLRDSDNDSLSDGDEVQIYNTNPLLRDTDSDSLEDAIEVQIGTDPTLLDTDGDGQPDGIDPSPLINNAQTSTPTITPIPLIDTSGLRYLNSTAFMPASISGAISLGDVVTGSITNEQPFALYSFEAAPGTEINITMEGSTSDGSDFYPRIMVVDPKGREVARTSDYSFDPQVSIRGLTLEEVGAYMIVASRVSGQFGYTSGNYELGVDLNASGGTQTGIISEPINYNDDVTNTIDDEHKQRVYTLQGREGDVITIEMTAQSSDLDPRILISDNLGNPLAINDDDYEARSFDSTIATYTLPRSGYYSIVATRYESEGAYSGPYRLLVQLDSQTPVGEPHAIEAPLDFINSIALRTDLEYYAEFSAGDSVDDDKNEVRLDALLTFYLPPLDADFELGSARLELAPCIERNQGFAALGDLSILEDAYGSLGDNNDFTRPAPGSSLLAQTSSCDVIDITDAVRNAYAEGRSMLQLRLTFRTPTMNGQPDSIAFTPRLILEPAG